MKVLLLSKALVSAQYRRKVAAIGRLGVDITAVVPPEWREGRGQPYEPGDDSSHRVIVTPIRFNGHFHVHYYPRLEDILRTERPDLFHIDEEPYNLATFLATRAAVRTATPSLFFTWQNIARRYPIPFSQMERYVYRNSVAAIAGSEEAKGVLMHKGFDRPVSVIPQFGVDPAVFSPGLPPSGPFTIGFFNRLVAAKNPLMMLDVLEALPSDSRLLIAGDGPLREQIEGEIRARALDSRVTLINRVPSAEMPSLMRSVHASVLVPVATGGWKEQFGRVLIEAMASGVPVVGSASGEIPAVVGDAGVLVPEADPRATAVALRRLYDDPLLRERLGARGRRRVLEHFSQDRIAEKTVAVYKNVLSGVR